MGFSGKQGKQLSDSGQPAQARRPVRGRNAVGMAGPANHGISGLSQLQAAADRMPAVQRLKQLRQLGTGKILQRFKHVEVNEQISQFLKDSQNTEGKQYTWQAKFSIFAYSSLLKDTENKIRVIIFVDSPAEKSVYEAWQKQINEVWSNKFAVSVNGVVHPITVEIHRPHEGRKHYDVENVKAEKALGKRGLFGTESMTKWGEQDPQDIPHEVGHMLGNPDEYGDVQVYNQGGKSWDKVPEPEEDSIMVKGDQPVRMRHLELIRSKVAEIPAFGSASKLIVNKTGGVGVMLGSQTTVSPTVEKPKVTATTNQSTISTPSPKTGSNATTKPTATVLTPVKSVSKPRGSVIIGPDVMHQRRVKNIEIAVGLRKFDQQQKEYLDSLDWRNNPEASAKIADWLMI